MRASGQNLSATSPAGLMLLLASSAVVGSLVLLVDPELAPRLWLALGCAAAAVVFVWRFHRAAALTVSRFDQILWAILISHTVIVSRLRDPRALAEDSGLTPQIAAEIAIWIALLLYTAFRLCLNPGRWANLVGPAARWAGLLFLAALASTLYAVSPLITAAWTLKLFVILILSCLMFDARDPLGSLDRFREATGLGLVLILGQFLILGTLSPDSALDLSPISGIPRLGGFLLPATQLATVSSLVLAMIALDYLCGRRSRWRALVFAAASIMLLASLGRSAMIALALTLFVVLALFRRVKEALVGSVALGILLISIPGLMSASWDLLSRRQGPQEMASLTGRIPLWEKAVELIWQKPLLGWGYVSGGRVAFLSMFKWWAPPHSHNAFLEILLALGVVGGVILLMLLYQTLRPAIQVLRGGWDRSRPGPVESASLMIVGLMSLLLVDGMFSAGFSGAPRFEATILVGCAFAADLVSRVRREKS